MNTENEVLLGKLQGHSIVGFWCLVLSFSQALKLNLCYVLKQNAEIFARFRSISQRILEKRRPTE